MYNLKLNHFGYFIVGLVLITFIGLTFSHQDIKSLDPKIALTDFFTTVTINVLIWSIFVKWLWKNKFLYPWLVPFPNLSGNWVGTIRSSWSGAESKEIACEMSIKQDFFHIYISLGTLESNSQSISASFEIDDLKNLRRLIYTYESLPNPLIRTISPIHFGSVVLAIDESLNKMTGEYWTSRQSFGLMRFTKQKLKSK